ncbi:MAG: flagellar biosynthesis protein FlhA, partial [Phycisphaerales bacterium]|nr:flagellar biosynthesis protein FlhA [Phycisphaerales bacterium]
LAWSMQRAQKAKAAQETVAAEAQAQKPPPGPAPEALLKLDTLELEVGYGLVAMVDTTQGGDLLDRISAIRRTLAVELGFILPPVRIRDNMQLAPSEYRVRIKGATIAKGETFLGRLLAMDSGIATGPIDGQPTREPAFNLPAWWIDPALRQRAETMNYTVVDPTSVVATHLTELVKTHAADLLTREEVNNLITQLKEKSPRLVEEVVPAIVKPGELQKVLQNLLRERVPIRDLDTILETLSDWGPKTKDLDVLTEYVRHALRRTICQQYATPLSPEDLDARGMNSGSGGAAGSSGYRVVCVTLDPAMEDLINAYIDRSGGATVVNMPARVASSVAATILSSLRNVTQSGHQPVVLASPQVRAVVRQLLEPHLPTVAVLGYNEAVAGVEIESVGLVSPPTGEAQTMAA